MTYFTIHLKQIVKVSHPLSSSNTWITLQSTHDTLKFIFSRKKPLFTKIQPNQTFLHRFDLYQKTWLRALIHWPTVSFRSLLGWWSLRPRHSWVRTNFQQTIRTNWRRCYNYRLTRILQTQLRIDWFKDS